MDIFPPPPMNAAPRPLSLLRLDHEDRASLLRPIHYFADERFRLSPPNVHPSSSSSADLGCPSASSISTFCRSSSVVNVSEPHLLCKSMNRNVNRFRRSFRRSAPPPLLSEVSPAASVDFDMPTFPASARSLHVRQDFDGAALVLMRTPKKSLSDVTPPATPAAAVPFQWEDAPGRPKPAPRGEQPAVPPPLPLPPARRRASVANSTARVAVDDQSDIVMTYRRKTSTCTASNNSMQMTNYWPRAPPGVACSSSCMNTERQRRRRRRRRRQNASVSSCDSMASSDESALIMYQQPGGRGRSHGMGILRHFFLGSGGCVDDGRRRRRRHRRSSEDGGSVFASTETAGASASSVGEVAEAPSSLSGRASCSTEGLAWKKAGKLARLKSVIGRIKRAARREAAAAENISSSHLLADGGGGSAEGRPVSAAATAPGRRRSGSSSSSSVLLLMKLAASRHLLSK